MTKQRTKQEIDQDYNNHAINLGHKMRLIAAMTAENEKHIDAMAAIVIEAAALEATLAKDAISDAEVTEVEPASPEAIV